MKLISKILVGYGIIFFLHPAILKADNSRNVNLLGKIIGGAPQKIFLKDNYAFVAASDLLSVYDISDPAKPVLLSYWGDKHSMDLYLDGNYAYLSGGSDGLIILDISNPRNLTEAGNYYTSYLAGPGWGYANNISGVDVSGNYAYITEAEQHGEAGLKILDVGNKASPNLVGYFPTPQAYDVEVSGKYAYVVDYSSGLYVVDISTPSSPKGTGFLAGDTYNRKIYVDNNYAYIIKYGAGLWIVDISVSSAPVTAGLWSLGYGYPEDVYVKDNKAYVSHGDNGFYIIDVSTPSLPKEIGNYKPAGMTLGLAIKDRTAYVCNQTYGLETVDISVSSAPQKTGQYLTLNYGYGLAISGNYAYLTEQPKNALSIVDISVPESPKMVGLSDFIEYPRSLAISGNYAYVTTLSRQNGLYIMDITNPQKVTYVTKLSTGSVGGIYGIQIDGNYAYLASYSNGLVIVDISNPQSPSIVGSKDTPGLAYDVAVRENYAYLADYNQGLRVFDIYHKVNPFEVYNDTSIIGAQGITISGRYAYVLDAYSDLNIYDLIIPTFPVRVANYDSGGWAYGIKIVNNLAYLANGSYKGLTVLDVSEPGRPVEAGYYTPPGSIYDLVPLGNKIYAPAITSGFWVLEFNPAFTINGYVKNSSATPVSQMPVTLEGQQTFRTVTNSSGFYEFNQVSIDTYTITVSSSNYIVNPSSPTFFLDKSYRNLDFLVTLKTYNLSGSVVDFSSNPLAGVTVNLTEILGLYERLERGKVLTDSSGTFLLANLAGNGSYEVSLSSPGYSFTPLTISTYTLNGNIPDLKFRGAAEKYFLDGFIRTKNYASLEEVKVTLTESGVSVTTFTSRSGHYRFEELLYGNSYVITAEKQYYDFEPSSRTLGKINTSIYNLDFTGSFKLTLLVSPGQLDFGEIIVGEKDTRTLTVSDSKKSGELQGTLAEDLDWVEISTNVFSGDSTVITVTVSAEKIKEGEYTGLIKINSNAGAAEVSVKILATCVLTRPNPYSLSSGKLLVFWGSGVVAGDTTVKIYTLDGSLVRELEEKEGKNEISWDGTNEQGNKVVPGIYLYTTSSPKEKNKGKITIIK